MFTLVELAFVILIGNVFVRDCKCDVVTSDNFVVNLLQKGYRKEIRPRCSNMSAVQVTIDMALRQIIEVNEPKQVLQTNVWLRLFWNDCRLAWNESEVGISTVVFPATLIWTPDLTLYDNAADGINKVSREYRVIVSSNGDTLHQMPVVLTSLCRIDTTHFPFDRQSCPLTFGMWAYNGLEVNLTHLNDTGDTASFKAHAEWSLSKLPGVRTSSYFNGVPYPTVIYTLELKRKPLFFVINLFFPCMLISAVAVLGFMVPSQAGEKVNLEVTVLLSLAVFQLIVLDMMPPSSETLPYISIYFASIMLLVSLSCFMAVIVLGVHFKGSQGRRVPEVVMRLFVDGLGRLLCVKRRTPSIGYLHSDEAVRGILYQRKLSPKSVHNGVDNKGANIMLDRVSSMLDKHQERVLFGENGTTFLKETDNVLYQLQNISERLENLMSRMAHRDFEENICQDWHLVAQVLDRTFMIVYSVVSATLLVVFLVKLTDQ